MPADTCKARTAKPAVTKYSGALFTQRRFNIMAENTAALVGRHKGCVPRYCGKPAPRNSTACANSRHFRKVRTPKNIRASMWMRPLSRQTLSASLPLSRTHSTCTPTRRCTKEIVSITDGELLGSEAVRNVVIVDLSQPAGETAGQFVAWKSRILSFLTLRVTARTPILTRARCARPEKASRDMPHLTITGRRLLLRKVNRAPRVEVPRGQQLKIKWRI